MVVVFTERNLIDVSPKNWWIMRISEMEILSEGMNLDDIIIEMRILVRLFQKKLLPRFPNPVSSLPLL